MEEPPPKFMEAIPIPLPLVNSLEVGGSERTLDDSNMHGLEARLVSGVVAWDGR